MGIIVSFYFVNAKLFGFYFGECCNAVLLRSSRKTNDIWRLCQFIVEHKILDHSIMRVMT